MPGAGVFGGEDAAAAVPVPAGVPGGRWLVLGKDGRLTAYARADTGLVRWTERKPGGPEWSRPEFFPAPDLTHLSVVQGADTYVHLLGRRARPRADGGAQIDIVHAIQYQSGRPVTEWRSLGTPHRDPVKNARFGAPAGAVDADGIVHVFARSAARTLMMRRESPSGKWEAWQSLKGGQLLEGTAAVAPSTGGVDVLAPAQNAALHWRRSAPGDAVRRERDLPHTPAENSVVGLETAPGSVTYYWSDAEGAGLVAHRPGGWWGRIGGTPGDSPVAVLRTPVDGHDCTVFALTGPEGLVRVAACPSEDEDSGLWWSATRERCVGTPGLARDASGRVVLAVVGEDGALRVARQRDEPGLAIAPATPV